MKIHASIIGKRCISLYLGNLDIGLGWYPGENWLICKIIIGEILEGIGLTVLSIQIAKFAFEILIDF